ncbi:MAG TPA: 2-dehydropantoate 2-reductase [Pseudosphingobacterium sp.]|jgi:2-dehydropantoate 2-reductase|nr:2-dehydropantoate 2-reductase [Pseudosphingobacterium sp.]
MRSVQEHVFIIGSGAIGKTLAVFLKLAGRKVTIIRGSVKNGVTKTECIRVEMADGALYEAAVEIATLDTFPIINGIIVLANKSFGNEQLAISLKPKTGNSPIVLLQNGLGVERPFINHQYPEIYRCVLFVTSQTVDNVTVRFKPVAICPIGIEQGNIDQLNDIVKRLDSAMFGFKSEVNIRQVVWKKAIVNCVFNSVCPLLEIDNGIFHRNQETFEIARRVISECITIANAEGVALHSNEVEASLLQISKFSDGQLISTLQDIRNNRRTEIETLNQEIVKIACKRDLQEVVRETRLLGELTKIKSEFALNMYLSHHATT